MAAAATETENPLTAGLERLPVAPTSLVIFGATGDLARRKLLPALYNLAHEGSLPERFHLIGVSRKDKAHEEFRAECEEAIRRFSRRKPDESVLASLLEAVKYVGGTFDEETVYTQLGTLLDEFERDAGEPLNRAFYLSTAPTFFPVIVEALGSSHLNEHEDAQVRVIIEKPFGTTLAEARELNRRVLAIFDESQVFRIDHYLGKETVQNMMAFRFANGMFEPLWNRNYIESVQITAAEELGIGSRADYYDAAGALRDLIQNHMLQLLCHIAMEPPVSFTAEEVRNEKVKVLQAVPKPAPEDVPQMGCAPSTRPGTPAARTCPATCKRRACPRARSPRPTRRYVWKSTTGAGRGSPSTCAPASAWRARSPRSRSRSSPSPTWPSARTARWACSPTSSC
jgi:glucose-6-phosphate 1-dehydrogenase